LFSKKIKYNGYVCCIHADALRLGAIQILLRIFRTFLEFYSHFSVSLFYLLEGSKIFFMSSKYIIWIVHAPI
jgi:hypothetical protein